MSDIVQKLWGFCHTLRHDGIDYGDYIEQITYLLFLKMADERSVEVPKGCSWPTIREKSGTELIDHYIDALRKLGKTPGILGDIYAGAQSRFNNPVNLKKLVSLIDETEWTSLGVDVKAAAYEGLLEKAAAEGKKGAGQYFTPRVLIQAIVRCMRPDPRERPDFTICDPAVGTGGFLVAAYEWFAAETKGVARPGRREARQDEDLLRRGAGRPAAAPGADEPVPARHRAAHPPGRLDLRAAAERALRRHPDEPALRHQGRQPGARARRLHDLDLEQAAQLRPARPDHPEEGRPRRGRAPRQLPLRRPGRRGLRGPGAGLRAAHGAAPAARHLHAVQPGREGQRRLLHQGRPDRARLDLRRPHQRPRHHEEGPPAHGRPLRRAS